MPKLANEGSKHVDGTESSMKILLVGGGSGGHLTPLLAVATELKKNNASCQVIHVGQVGEALDEVMQHESVDESIGIQAGKFRRYHGESFLSHLFDLKTVILNIRDLFRFLHGTIQAYRLLGRQKPDAILLKGGYVCVPVGFAARLRKIPYATHDSDAIPGLANRLTAKHAAYNAVAMPADGYLYDQAKTIQTGIPIREEFVPVTTAIKNAAKKQLGYKPTDKLLFVVGGGLGARNVNEAIASIAQSLLRTYPQLQIVHLTGKSLYTETQKLYSYLEPSEQGRVKLVDFTTELYLYSAASDVAITRAGATNLAEFAAQTKPIIIVPNPVLTGGQQLHNAKIIAEAKAALIVEENDSVGLKNAVDTYMSMSDLDRSIYGSALHNVFPQHGAAKMIAELLVAIANKTLFHPNKDMVK